MGLEIPQDLDEQAEKLTAASEEVVEEAQAYYVSTIFSEDLGSPAPELNGEVDEFQRAVFGLEAVGLDLHDRHSSRWGRHDKGQPWNRLVWPAFRIRRALAFSSASDVYGDEKERRWNLVDEAVDAVVAKRQPEIRFQLRDEDLLINQSEDDRWDKFLQGEICRAFLFAVRKRGREDLTRSIGIIERLREGQESGEQTIERIEEDSERRIAALRSVALYHAAKAVDLTSQFLRDGPAEENGIQTANDASAKLERFVFNAREALKGNDTQLLRRIDRLRLGCQALIDNSIHAVRLPSPVTQFVSQLANREKKPILEFWYAQRAALDQQLLDLTRGAVVVSLPTSTGKTLLAELAMVQAKDDNPDGTIVYVAPTRALVTQTSLTLKRDFQGTDLKVRVATPSFEIDPVEDEVLASEFDILVATPEKLDLLIKDGHPAVDNMSLLVVDEAHNISDGERGSRLELLLATVRREQSDCRFLLLTPFADNAQQLADWLGAGAGSSVVLDWKPNDRILGSVEAGYVPEQGAEIRPLEFTTLDSPHSDCPSGVEIDLGTAPRETRAAPGAEPRDTRGAKKRVAVESVKKLSRAKSGGTLLLSMSRAKAEKRAAVLAEDSNEIDSELVDLVIRFLNTEAGEVHPLSPLLSKGVAFHHAGLSPEARYLVERLVEEGKIPVVCATTTLAQGVHFPLSAAVIEGHHRSFQEQGNWQTEELPHMEFWNIAGRVGRTLEDSMGTIAFASTGPEDVEELEGYLEEDSNRVVSSLMEALESLSGEDLRFNLELIDEYSELSSFLQYLVHALAVAGEHRARREVEDLLRNSFVYQEAERVDGQLADELVRIARRYYDRLIEREGEGVEGYAKLADGTGFSSPSVDLVRYLWRDETEPSEWTTESLFQEEQPDRVLTDVMKTLGKIPEINLGNREEGEFSPERVARITSRWVNGQSITEIASQEYSGDLLECTRHVYSAVTNLVPWGMRAIQRVSFGGEEVDWDRLELLPAMVYHGVRSEEAIGLRMLGVPRFAAEGVASAARNDDVEVGELDEWLRGLESERWERALPEDAEISGLEARELWMVLEGELSIDEIEQ